MIESNEPVIKYKKGDNVIVTGYEYDSPIETVLVGKSGIVVTTNPDGMTLVQFESNWNNMMHRGTELHRITEEEGTCWWINQNVLGILSFSNSDEYIYNMNLLWKNDDNWNSVTVVPGFICVNVKRLQNNSFTFNIKDDITNTLYRTNYGWSFIENTDNNIMKYNEYLRVTAEIKRLQQLNEVLFDNIIHLGKESC